MTISLTASNPPIYQYTIPPGLSVPFSVQTQLLFDQSDTDPNSNGLYFLKNPTLGTQNWLKFCTINQLNNAIAAIIPPARTQSSASRSLNSAFQLSAVRDSLVSYSVEIACTLSLTGGQTGTVFLEIATNSAFTTGVQEITRAVNGNTGTLTIGLNISQNSTGTISGYVPAGYYCRLRTANTTGTPTFNYRSGQEVLL